MALHFSPRSSLFPPRLQNAVWFCRCPRRGLAESLVRPWLLKIFVKNGPSVLPCDVPPATRQGAVGDDHRCRWPRGYGGYKWGAPRQFYLCYYLPAVNGTFRNSKGDLKIPHSKLAEYRRSRLYRSRRTVNRSYGEVLYGNNLFIGPMID
ncbi:hypothetical protein ACMD2_14114 [Ananas comosus]|uniref:Uncharacterized protein n=1 Tax=Ananas comosus TaxID=4615 RepID=A0A199VAS8_ANACO|nr:hypothetical protein ACMD2_14114 [Ananas comosus]